MKSYTYFLITVFYSALALSSCVTSHKVVHKKLQSQIENSDVFKNSFSGFALYNLQEKQYLFQKNADKYFTPASNTKLFTFYTALKTLGDSIPSFTYSLQADTVYIWGLGDPTTLHPAFSYQDALLGFLKKQKDKAIYLCKDHFKSEKYGPGWAWDDYPYYYQSEKSALPLYGNTIWFRFDSLTSQISYFPNAIPMAYKPSTNIDIARREAKNEFTIQVSDEPHSSFSFGIPFTENDQAMEKIISQNIGKPIQVINQCPGNLPKKIVFGSPADTVYRFFLQNSDNLIAEQLLLNASSRHFNVLDSKKMIDYAKQEWLPSLPDEPLWYDGSGLSRYNLFTPRSIISLLRLMHNEMPEGRLFSLLPAGGQSGTIKNWYAGKEPYIFAKTGTLRKVHCLSGYLKTKKGNTLLFSFMHNHYKGSTTSLKKEMEKILSFIRDHY